MWEIRITVFLGGDYVTESLIKSLQQITWEIRINVISFMYYVAVPLSISSTYYVVNQK